MMRTILFFVFVGLATISRCEERLITNAGKHTAKDGKISVELSIPDKQHVKFRVLWEGERQLEEGRIVIPAWEESFDDPFPVAAEKWAFCFVGKDELWFYDGEGTFYRYKGARDGLSSSATCSPGGEKLGDAAPQTLKKWIEEKRRTRR